MRSNSSFSGLMRTCYLTVLLCAFCCAPVFSATKTQLAIGQDVFEQMQEAQVVLEQDNYAEATALLNKILESKNLNNFEKAQTWSLQGNVYFHMERYDLALDAFKKAVSYENLPEGFMQISLRTVAQLAFMQDQYTEALKYANQLIEISETPDSGTYMLKAQIYYKMEDEVAALRDGLIAIDLERKAGNVIKENWLLIINAIYYNMENFAGMVDILKELIEFYPKDQYVKNLAAIYGQMDKTEKQLLLMEPLYEKGYLQHETELVNLAQLMLMYKVPYKAAKIIEQGFQDGSVNRNQRNLELLAQSWQLAASEEESVIYLAEAAELNAKEPDNDGNLYNRLAQSYINLYRWKDAENALVKALKLGKLDREGDTHLLLGMTRFYQKEYSSARKAFRQASEFERTSKLADQWLTYLEQEKKMAEAAE